MQSRSLVILCAVALLAFIGVTAAMVMKSMAPARPPMHGAMRDFKLSNPPMPVPAGAFVDAEGQPHDLGLFKGKITLIQFWTKWCEVAPCDTQLKSLDRLKRARDGANFQVVAISENQGGDIPIVDYYKKQEITSLPHFADSEQVFSRQLKFDHFPTTILLGADGKELARYDGKPVDWDAGDVLNFLDFYIAPPKPAGG
jgi:cytochrome oxidase Cu insertion factor (SCO1/SenC/PrrC family)